MAGASPALSCSGAKKSGSGVKRKIRTSGVHTEEAETVPNIAAEFEQELMLSTSVPRLHLHDAGQQQASVTKESNLLAGHDPQNGTKDSHLLTYSISSVGNPVAQSAGSMSHVRNSHDSQRSNQLAGGASVHLRA